MRESYVLTASLIFIILLVVTPSVSAVLIGGQEKGVTIINNFTINGTQLNYTDILGIPTYLSNFTNNVGFINLTNVANLNNRTLSDWLNITSKPTLLSYFTDDLGNRGYTSLSNFTDNLGSRGYNNLLNFTNGANFYNATNFVAGVNYIATESDPYWSGNKSNVALLNAQNNFTVNQTFAYNITVSQCIIFGTGGKICGV